MTASRWSVTSNGWTSCGCRGSRGRAMWSTRRMPLPKPTYYLTLGDSLAAGAQPNASGATVATNEGYADFLCAIERHKIKQLKLEKLGCLGETTTSMGLAGHGTVPLAVKRICQLTWMCAPPPAARTSTATRAATRQSRACSQAFFSAKRRARTPKRGKWGVPAGGRARRGCPLGERASTPHRQRRAQPGDRQS